MEKLKFAFAFAVMVALVGVGFVTVESSSASEALKYVTLRAAEQVSFSDIGHICNENNATCQVCNNRAGQNQYSIYFRHCTNNAYQDCGQDTDVCYCNTYPEQCSNPPP